MNAGTVELREAGASALLFLELVGKASLTALGGGRAASGSRVGLTISLR